MSYPEKPSFREFHKIIIFQEYFHEFEDYFYEILIFAWIRPHLEIPT